MVRRSPRLSVDTVSVDTVAPASVTRKQRWTSKQKQDHKRLEALEGVECTPFGVSGVLSARKGPPPAVRPDPAEQAQHPLLILLDLNGTLVHRETSTAPFAIRPGTLQFLQTLRRHVNLCFYTSMQPTNAKRAVLALVDACRLEVRDQRLCAAHGGVSLKAHPNDEDIDPSLGRFIHGMPLFAGDDYHFQNDVGLPLLPLRVPSLEPWRLLRQPSRIWADPQAKGHTATSTIMVDDTPGKRPLTLILIMCVVRFGCELRNPHHSHNSTSNSPPLRSSHCHPILVRTCTLMMRPDDAHAHAHAP